MERGLQLTESDGTKHQQHDAERHPQTAHSKSSPTDVFGLWAIFAENFLELFALLLESLFAFFA